LLEGEEKEIVRKEASLKGRDRSREKEGGGS